MNETPNPPPDNNDNPGVSPAPEGDQDAIQADLERALLQGQEADEQSRAYQSSPEGQAEEARQEELIEQWRKQVQEEEEKKKKKKGSQ